VNATAEYPSSARVHPDPVFSALHLPLRRTFFPLGYPLALETNSQEVLQAAEESWGDFECMSLLDPVRFSLGVSGNRFEGRVKEPTLRAREHLMSIVSDPENFLLCDFERGFAFGWVTPGVAANRPWLRYHFLAAGASTLAQQRAFAPLHGALVARNNSGVLLCGESCAGKSTLAYACARAGWTYISDDGTFLVRERDDRYAVGDCHHLRLRADAPGIFAELADCSRIVRPNGKMAIELRTRQLGISTAAGCTIDQVVFLDRQPIGPAALQPYPKSAAMAYWSRYIVLGTDELREAQRRCQERLLSARISQMQYSDLGEAVSLLERLVDEGVSSPGVHGCCAIS